MQGKILSKRYLLAEEIGNGGMGSVFRATDLRTGGPVAVKIPHPFLARDPEYTERLRREAQIAASIYSPRIVRVIDLDADEDGSLFLVMEYVPGATLLDELRARGSLPVTEALTLGLETARALDAAHQKGIIHRDLKPHNIKLVDGEIKILDFGIAKIEGLPGVTSASVFMGTPEYSAPERAEGLGDIRSDIYSVGVILYEALAGHLPFSGLNPMAVLRKHELEPPPPLPVELPEDVVAIVMRCLAKRPEDRYQTPRDLINDIGAALRGMPLPTPPPGEIRRGLAHPVLPTTPPPAAAPAPPPIGVTVLDQRLPPPAAGPASRDAERGTRPPAAPAHDGGTVVMPGQAAGTSPPPVPPTVVGAMLPAADGTLPGQGASGSGWVAARVGGTVPPAAEVVAPEARAAVPRPTAERRGMLPPTRDFVSPGRTPPSGTALVSGRPARLPRLIGGGVAVVLVAGGIAAAVALGGFGGGGDKQLEGSATTRAPALNASPATAPAQAAAATPAPAALVTATGPTRAPVVAKVPLDRGRNADERSVLETLNGANAALVLAFRKADMAGLDAYFIGQALTDYMNSINGSLKRQGRYAVADLTKIDLLKLTIDTPTRATVQTRESLEYNEFLLTTDERVPNAGYTATQLWTYHLVKKDGRWLIEEQDKPVQE